MRESGNDISDKVARRMRMKYRFSSIFNGYIEHIPMSSFSGLL